MVAKPDGSPFSLEEQQKLLTELNSQFPAKIRWEPDGYFQRVVILKAKNYILYDGKTIKTKGSSIRDGKREPALRQFINDLIEALVHQNTNYVEIYEKYAKEICNITDIHRWKTKKTITEKVLNPERTNEQKVKDALGSAEYSEGDKAHFYYTSDGNLRLVEQWNGDYDKVRYLEKLYKTAMIFMNVIPKETFINYKLKRNQEGLEKLNE